MSVARRSQKLGQTIRKSGCSVGPWLIFVSRCIGKGNGNPFQCSCLENPRDGGAWWAAVSGVSQSWTRLKRLSSSSSSRRRNNPQAARIPMDFRGKSGAFSSVQFSCSVMSDSLQPHGLQHARLLCPSPASRAYSSSCPLSR